MIKELNVVNEIKDNYCIGCGVCSVQGDNSIKLDEFGKYQLSTEVESRKDAKKILEVCPFSNNHEDENGLSDIFLKGSEEKDPILGRFINNFIGHVTDEKVRMNASSGGVITWLLLKLLEKEKITQAVFVGSSEDQKADFEYKISDREEDIINGASSKYYPVELSKTLKYIEENEGKYAVVALPCFAKGLRLLQKNNPVFLDRVEFIISPFCGHLKSINYQKFLAMQQKISPLNLTDINYREKIKGNKASQYGTKFTYTENSIQKEKTVENSSFKMGTNWGHGMFKYAACDYCDDIVGEVADVSVGDAWLKEYTKDYKGNSAVVVRNEELNKIFKEGVKNNELSLEYVDADVIRESQSGGIRHKRSDLSYRLALKDDKGEWYPQKRIDPSKNHLSQKRKKVIKLRMKIRNLSHKYFLEALKKNDVIYFYENMEKILNEYRYVYKGKWKYLKQKIKYLVPFNL